MMLVTSRWRSLRMASVEAVTQGDVTCPIPNIQLHQKHLDQHLLGLVRGQLSVRCHDLLHAPVLASVLTAFDTDASPDTYV